MAGAFLSQLVDTPRPWLADGGLETDLIYGQGIDLPLQGIKVLDLTRLLPPTARSFRRMGKITGRSDDMLIVRGVNVFPTQVEEQILRDQRLSGNYQVVLTRDGPLDNLEVRCEVQREVSASLSQDLIAAIAKELQHHIKTNVGVSTRVTVMHFEGIPRTLVGKAKRVMDLRVVT